MANANDQLDYLLTLNRACAIVIPYQEPMAKTDGPDMSSTMSQTLPMAAIFMRNRYIGWYTHILPRSSPLLAPNCLLLEN